MIVLSHTIFFTSFKIVNIYPQFVDICLPLGGDLWVLWDNIYPTLIADFCTPLRVCFLISKSFIMHVLLICRSQCWTISEHSYAVQMINHFKVWFWNLDSNFSILNLVSVFVHSSHWISLIFRFIWWKFENYFMTYANMNASNACLLRRKTVGWLKWNCSAIIA